VRNMGGGKLSKIPERQWFDMDGAHFIPYGTTTQPPRSSPKHAARRRLPAPSPVN
jgi:hypothetical protein